jgi:hypothetical protein
MKQSLYNLLLVSCLALMLWANPVTTDARGGAGAACVAKIDPAVMPGQCQPGKTSPQAMGWRWRPDALVRVYYLKDSFDGAQSAALSRAVNNWNQALKEIDSRIFFIVGGEREGVSQDDASITVMRGIPTKTERLAEIKFYSTSNGVTRMIMTIRPVVEDPSALTSLMTHELGHSLGLADCYECRRGTTAMSAFKDNNKGNDVYEPSVCDKYVVAAGYASQTGAQARVASTGRK